MSKTEVPQWAREAWAKVVLDQGRANFIEKLYWKAGRDNPDHPHHHTYTGLYQEYLANRAKKS